MPCRPVPGQKSAIYHEPSINNSSICLFICLFFGPMLAQRLARRFRPRRFSSAVPYLGYPDGAAHSVRAPWRPKQESGVRALSAAPASCRAQAPARFHQE